MTTQYFSSSRLIAFVCVFGLSACDTVEELLGPSPDLDRVKWHDLAEKGDPEAQYQLGRLHAQQGRDTAKAVYWLCRAAVQGYTKAQYALARVYENKLEDAKLAKGTLSNRVSAYFWYTAAASQGNEDALKSRARLETAMDANEIKSAKRRATYWKQAVCLKPKGV